MITEDYVSFEIAKLLKEKGFDTPCNCYGAYNGVNLTYRLCITGKYTNWNKHTDKLIISCPTQQMVMKWLREVHNICIVVTPSMFWGKYNVSIYKKDTDYPIGFDGDSLIPSYEQACNAAIKYCHENLI